MDQLDRRRRFSSSALVRRLLLTNKALLFAILFAVVLAFASPYFLTTRNLLNLLSQIAVMTIVALAVTLVIGAAEIDLSIGGIVALVGIVIANLMAHQHVPMLLAMVVGIVVGAVCGMANALLISRFSLPPFIVTLATNSLFVGIVYISTNMVPVSGLPKSFVFLGQGHLGPVPVPVVIMLPFAVIMYVVARRTTFGRYVVAFGGSPEAVRLAGIRVGWLRFGMYVIVGVACAIASIVLTALSASAQIGAGSDLMLNVIAAVVIGGTPLAGGKTDMIGTFFGCVIMGMISNGLNLLGVNPNFQVISQGMLILLALLADVQSSKFLAHRMAAGVRLLRGGHEDDFAVAEPGAQAR